jgi:hypothetical protein
MSLADAVTGAVRLYRCRSGPDLATLQVAAEKEGESPVVRIAPAAFTEAMLLAVAAAEQGAGGRTCRVRVTYGTEPGGGGRIRIERLGEGPEPGDAVLEGLTESEVLEAAEERIEDAGGRLARLDDGRFEIFVPSGVGAWAAAGLIPEASNWRG